MDISLACFQEDLKDFEHLYYFWLNLWYNEIDKRFSKKLMKGDSKMTVFYDRLHELAESRGISFKKIEQDMSYPHNSLANYRQGKDPGAKRILELADYFSVSPNYLLCETSSEITSEIELALKKLSENRQVEILKFVKESLMDQKNEHSDNAVISVVELMNVGDGDTVWKKGNTKKIEVPLNRIPDDYDIVVQIFGTDTFLQVKDEDILFIKFGIKKYKRNSSHLISADIKFTELPQPDGSVLYIKNYSENNANINIGEVTGIYHVNNSFNFARDLI
ncbi:helix-turn-helix domain-containing protein [Lactovum odontotermitis]